MRAKRDCPPATWCNYSNACPLGYRGPPGGGSASTYWQQCNIRQAPDLGQDNNLFARPVLSNYHEFVALQCHILRVSRDIE
jgi:hypothetical protein